MRKKLITPDNANHMKALTKVMSHFPDKRYDKELRQKIYKILKERFAVGYTTALKKSKDELVVEYGKLRELENVKYAWDADIRHRVPDSEDIDTIVQILRTIGLDIFEIKASEYNPKSHKRKIADFHKVMFYILREHNLTFTEIGNICSKDHSSVVIGIQKFHNLLKYDKVFFRKFHHLVKVMKGDGIKLPISVLISAGIYEERVYEVLED